MKNIIDFSFAAEQEKQIQIAKQFLLSHCWKQSMGQCLSLLFFVMLFYIPLFIDKVNN